ncbi:unnamed protein product [Effrenium voratum]|uniref:Uncharacterized protein n=1 Tax=Effrenium voratum TaxID=2562239 RepID=A0AA36MVF6_9DINO|nr:unnamed protein product [Effrenium voratum]CAJ1433396.1 unnamed protein product [Effrenium voratum]
MTYVGISERAILRNGLDLSETMTLYDSPICAHLGSSSGQCRHIRQVPQVPQVASRKLSLGPLASCLAKCQPQGGNFLTAKLWMRHWPEDLSICRASPGITRKLESLSVLHGCLAGRWVLSDTGSWLVLKGGNLRSSF